jgi:hypothetical protein
MRDKTEAWLILISLIAVVGGAYVLAWRGKHATARGWGAWTIALVSGLGAVVATSYFVGGLDDFLNPRLSFWTTFLGNLIMLAICLGAWTIAIRFAIISTRKGPSK